MEKTVGIHRDWVQPSYYFETADRWWKRRGGAKGSGENGRAVLFTTCFVNYSDPVAARSAVVVLEHSGVRVDVAYERCCGMPFTDVGDLESARRNAEQNVADLLPHVEAGALIVAPGPSCSLMLKHEYPKLVKSEAARKVAAATRDLMEYVVELARAKNLKRDFQHKLGHVAYHAPCHLRAQNIGFRSRDVLKLVAEEVTLIDACSGVDGTWACRRSSTTPRYRWRRSCSTRSEPAARSTTQPTARSPACASRRACTRRRCIPSCCCATPTGSPPNEPALARRHSALDVFEAIRDDLRARVIAHKAPRRVALGDRVTLLFEDRETIRWQVLEMCRVERTRDASGVAHEIAVYNELIPGARELSATMFIEITETRRSVASSTACSASTTACGSRSARGA